MPARGANPVEGLRRSADRAGDGQGGFRALRLDWKALPTFAIWLRDAVYFYSGETT